MIGFNENRVTEEFLSDPIGWLSGMANKYNLTTLLGFADNSVLWGMVKDGGLILADTEFPGYQQPFDPGLLQELRLFGSTAELHLWRADDHLYFHVQQDTQDGKPGDTIDEIYLLWGGGLSDPKPAGGFTLMQEGQQKFYHTPPLPEAAGKHGSLTIRHYLVEDPDGQMIIQRSRLVRLNTKD